MSAPRVVEITDADVKWPFGQLPHVVMGGSRRTTIDPYPCYAHPVDLVEKTLRKLERDIDARRKVKARPTIYLLHHEADTRTNGWAEQEHGCRCEECVADGSAGEPRGIITLAGKRIPLHPAMTRYLVGHEYGHHAEYELLRRRDKVPGDNTVAAEYAKMRGLTSKAKYYGGRQWHLVTGEVIANDFRILLGGIEEEFWPHEVRHPAKDKVVQRWWEENW